MAAFHDYTNHCMNEVAHLQLVHFNVYPSIMPTVSNFSTRAEVAGLLKWTFHSTLS